MDRRRAAAARSSPHVDCRAIVAAYYPRVVGVRREWKDLEPRTRRLIVVASAMDGLLKIAALIDLARRPSNEVRGSKAGWAVAVSLINSLGAVPIAYFVWGRRNSGLS